MLHSVLFKEVAQCNREDSEGEASDADSGDIRDMKSSEQLPSQASQTQKDKEHLTHP